MGPVKQLAGIDLTAGACFANYTILSKFLNIADLGMLVHLWMEF